MICPDSHYAEGAPHARLRGARRADRHAFPSGGCRVLEGALCADLLNLVALSTPLDDEEPEQLRRQEGMDERTHRSATCSQQPCCIGRHHEVAERRREERGL